MTLLASVNRVLRDLREDSIDSLNTSDEVQGVVDALNRAAERVLRYEDWSFLERYDSQMFFPARFTATAGGLGTHGSATVSINAGAVNSWNTTEATKFTENIRARLRLTDDSAFGNTSYVVTQFLTSGAFNAILETAFRSGASNGITSGAVEVYASEYVLPSTVRAILSIRNEEEPLQIRSVGDRHFEFDSAIPRRTDTFQDPYIAYVGGYGTGSRLSSGTADTGMLVTIWPAPSDDLVLHYDSMYQHASLSDDSDEWAGVPAEHVSVIEEFALADRMMGNRQADAERGVVLERRAMGRLDALQRADRKQPHKRMVMRPYEGRRSMRGYWSRWDDQTPEWP